MAWDNQSSLAQGQWVKPVSAAEVAAAKTGDWQVILSLPATRRIDAELLLAGFYEDYWDTQATPLNAYMPSSTATLAIQPKT